MSLISGSLPNLINGVSQQPPAVRLPSQAESQVNFLSDNAKGLTRRPPLRHMAKASPTPWTDAFIHTINRDENEKYVVQINNGDLNVFDLDGNEKVVNFPNGKDYLLGSSAGDFRAITVADYTFIVNTSKVVQMSTLTSPVRDDEALVNVAVGQYGMTYKILVDNVVEASFTTPDGSVASHASQISTDYIATQLKTQLDVNLSASFGWIIQKLGSTIYISRDSAFTISTIDGGGGKHMTALKGGIHRFSDLPRTARTGFEIEVSGEASSNFDNYYVAYDYRGGGFNNGVWVETRKQGIPYRFGFATMPHALIRNSDGTFTFDFINYADRLVGDEVSAPNPSFVGKQIRGVFFWRNRLGFISDESVILSAAGDFFRFFPKTVTTVLAGDPIDVSVSHTKVSILNHAIPYAEKLLLVSNETQFVLDGGDVLSPSSVSIDQVSEYSVTPGADIKSAGRSVFMPVTRGDYAGLREFFLSSDESTAQAPDITAHVPTYIRGPISKLATAENNDTIVAFSSAAPQELCVYEYLYDGQGQKIKSSWSKIVLPSTDTILNVDFIDSELIVVIARSDGTYFEKMDIATGSTDTDTRIQYHMDRLIYETDLVSATFDGTDTTLTLPYSEDAELWVVARSEFPPPNPGDPVPPPPVDPYPEGTAIAHTRPTSTTIKIAGADLTGEKLVIGRKYLSYYTLSTIYPREVRANSVEAVLDGRLQLKTVSFNYSETGYLEALVNWRYRGTFTAVDDVANSGLADYSFIAGNVAIGSGTLRVPLMANTKDVTVTIQSDHFLPLHILSVSWEGVYARRSRRL